MRRSVVLLSMLIMIYSLALAAPSQATDSLSQVMVAEKKVELSGSSGVDQIRYFTLDSPKRLVVDLYGVVPGTHEEQIPLTDGFKLLRIGPQANKTRFVFDVDGNSFPIFNVNTDDEQVVVTWELSENAVVAASQEPAPSGSSKITSIDFASEDGQSKLLISLDGKAMVTNPVRDGNKIQFSVKNTTLPRSLRREFDTLAFPSAIYSATPYLVNAAGQPEVRFVVLLKGDVPYRLQETSTGYVFNVTDGSYAQAGDAVSGMQPVPAEGQFSDTPMPMMPAASLQPGMIPAEGQAPVPVIEQIGGTQQKRYTGEKTSLVFDSADVRDILRLIAEISELNIIAADDVEGNVTLRLIDVPWDQALDLILDVTGLGMLQDGNVVRVLPKERIRSMKEAELTAARSQEKLEPLATEVVSVSYADLKSVAAPARDLLSDRGTITEDSRNKLLIVTDVQQRINQVKDLIAILDTPERQVMIEARIVQVNSNYSRDLGVNWYLFADSDGGSSDPTFSSLTGGGGSFFVDIFDEDTGDLLITSGLNSTMSIGNILDDVVLDLQISALESNGKGKVISTPRVTTLNGEKAAISQGTTIPYQTSGADGPKTEFVNAELKLEVTPVINPDDSIILEILATNDSPSVTTGATAPSIDTKRAETKVLVKDGETTVIGGIFVENVQESDEGIPVLMNIPILGHAFKASKRQTTRDELLVFITPRIMHEE